MNKPNLFIVWAPKCGTSSMHYYLSQHPEIFMSDPKEPYFFCTDFHKESDFLWNWKTARDFRTMDQYIQIFNNVKNEKVIWEASTWYLYSKEAAKNIYNYNKNAKIIIMLREPIDFLYSSHSQMLFTWNEVEKKFANALKLEIERKKNWKIKHSPYPSSLYYSETIKFSDQIERYLKYFDHKNIKIILFNDLKNNIWWVYKDLLCFLDIENINFIPDFKLQNPNRKILFKWFKKIVENKILWGLPKILLPTKLYNYIRDFLYKIIISYKERPPLNNDFKIELMKKYKMNVIELNNLLHKNNLISKDKNLIELWWYNKI